MITRRDAFGAMAALAAAPLLPAAQAKSADPAQLNALLEDWSRGVTTHPAAGDNFVITGYDPATRCATLYRSEGGKLIPQCECREVDLYALFRTRELR